MTEVLCYVTLKKKMTYFCTDQHNSSQSTLKGFQLCMPDKQDNGFILRKTLLRKFFQMLSGLCDQQLTAKLVAP